jgi:predicted MPP superfamily phosphohydrolase
MPSARITFFIPLTVSVLIGVYGHIEALNIRTERVVIKSPKIPEKVGKLRIVQISDVHLGLIMGEWRLERILREVRRAHPDILVSTGDLLDGQVNNISKMADKINGIRTPYGKYAVTGNHEFHAGIGRSLAFAEEAGFTVLRGEKLEIPGLIIMAGVDDATANRFGGHGNTSEKQLLSGLPQNRFVVLLKHRPLVESESEGLFDLQLSGHTHGGQIFPFSLIIKLLYPIDKGLLPLWDGAFLYVNQGSGTWGPPMRFLVQPEVTIIDLVHGG